MLAATLAMMLALLATDARGQMNPLRQLALTTADIELLTATANRVYETGQIGTKEAWSNPESGNSGTVELLETFEREGLPCRRVEHVVNIARDAVPKRLVLATCRVADGRWLLV
jgi:surface antigen